MPYFQIFIKGIDGKTIFLGHEYKLNEDTSIKTLKEHIKEREGIDTKAQRLIYGTR